HMFISYQPTQLVLQFEQSLKTKSYPLSLHDALPICKQFWGKHFWARGYLAVASGVITDEVIAAYIEEQEGEAIHDDSRFPIDSWSINPTSASQGRSVVSRWRMVETTSLQTKKRSV